ncbi:MAG: (2Fe-2S)-binding protein [Myxococcales bacterium]|nr:(2Fe-2S)-binding protein [Myxococcales bacterium]
MSDRDPSDKPSLRVSRRRFLQVTGIGAVSGLAPTKAGALVIGGPSSVGGVRGPDAVGFSFRLNGKSVTTKAEPRTTLAELLRDQLGLTGTKIVCDRGACGGCTVLVEGEAVNSCMMLALDVEGKQVATVEGLASNGTLHALQQAFLQEDALQCGYCTPGFLMSAKCLLDRVPNPTHEQIRHELAGNLCRCGSYPHIFAAVEKAARTKRGG